MAQKTKNTNESGRFVVARSEDGTVQITFTIPYPEIEKEKKSALEALSKDTEVQGFRKGKAPLDKIEAQIPQNTLLEKTLTNILPKYLGEAIEKEKIKLAIYPKFEILKNEAGKNWEIRATTCEVPEIILGDYKNKISGVLRAQAIWKPGDATENPKEKTKEQKESDVIKTLLSEIKVTIPHMLIDEEVNLRLSRLLERLEKLSLSLDSYLASIGKTIDQIREEYQKQAREALSLDIILNKIATDEGIKVDEKEIEKVISLSQVDKNLENDLSSPEKRRMIQTVLLKRSALDLLVNLA